MADTQANPQLTIAQAVAAATQAQNAAQQQAANPSPPVQAPQQAPTSTADNLACQWQGCGERCDTAEALYDHVCERHVGRKSTNNLNLTCQWGSCRTTTVKRDHITSHIRVHVPLKPHKCDFCGKSFKRPQDLKKHVKTHADDSVLTNSPGQGGRGSIGGGMTSNGKANSSYYPGHDGQMANPYPGYQASMGANGHNAGYQPASQYAGYGSVSYPNSAAAGNLQSMDTRRRAIEALNDFLGDIKRRAINPGTYYDVGHRLGGHNSLPLPSGNGYNTGYSNTQTNPSFGNFSAAGLIDSFNNHSDGMGGVQSAVHGTYGLPLPNARTKNDLQDIDRFLEQLQATVYETSNQAAAAGVQQPGVHAQYTGDYGFGNGQYQSRPSHSPPAYQNGTAATFGGLTAAAVPSTSAMDTPALTPASVSSYSSSGQSPLSSHGRASMSSVGGNAMYPNLPSVTGMSDLGSGYPTTTSAPASGLASGYDGLDGRRYSGGRLQRQAPAKEDTEMPDADDGSRTPKADDAKRPKSKGNSSIDPALRGEDSSETTASTPAAKSEAEDKRQEEWIENIRTIESLRKWIGERLSRGDYEQEGQRHAKEGASNKEDDAAASIAKLVEAKVAALPSALSSTPSGPPAKTECAGAEVKYPSLPTAA